MREHWTLDPEVVFLNHGSFGACPRVVLEHQAALRARLEREPVRFLVHELEGRLEAAREAVADFVGARPGNLAFVRNATSGVNAVLRSLRLEPGDALLVTDHAYNACRNAVTFVAERWGARVDVASIPFPIASPDAVLDAVLGRVTGRTRLALIDHVTSPTGLVLPVDRIVRVLAERGVDTLVDGAHGPGMVPLELESLGAAWYAANFHKWTCAPKGAGMLWAREDRQAGIHPAVISHGYNSRRTRSRFLEEFDWAGTDDPTPWLCVPEAIRVVGGLLEGGWPAVRARNHALACRGRDRLCEALGIAPPAPDAMLGALAAVPVPDASGPPPETALGADPLHERLFREHRIEVPVFPWPAPRRRMLRISAHLYNTEADYERLAAALR